MALFLLGLWIARPGLDNGWFYDDLHRIRSYSGAELESTLTGTSDPDEIETRGWRPLQSALLDARYQLFGEDQTAHRIAMIAALAAALTVFVAALAIAGVPPWLTVPAAAIELTAKNIAPSLVWITDGYHDFQMLAFGLALLLVAVASRSRDRTPRLLGFALMLWCITLGIKDQGVVLLPILAGLPVFIHLIASRRPVPAAGYVALVSGLGAGMAWTWRRKDLRWFVIGAAGIAVLDAVLRRVFVPSAPSGFGPGSVRHLGAQARYVVEFAGRDHLPAVYLAVAAIAVAFVILWPRFFSANADVVTVQRWRTALLAGCGSLFAAMFALVFPRSDLVLFPLFFYALFLCTSATLAWRLLSESRLRLPLAVAASFAVAASITTSVRASRAVQEAMSPMSIQTLDYSYELLQGDLSDHVTIPAERRAEELARLRTARVDGYVGPTAYRKLFCTARERRARGLPQRIVIPTEYLFQDDGGYPPPRPSCRL